ncbi:hypothetical protein BH24ACT26_BH24ACT26_15180 [soil metagenome]
MAYEIKVVFQSVDAYQSAVDRLYQAFGVNLAGASLEPSRTNGAAAHPARLEIPEATVSLDDFLLDDPSHLPDEGYNFIVEDRTARG